MHANAAELLKAAESATDHFIKALTYDLEIVSDYLKHSLWLNSLAVAGVAFALSKWSAGSSLPVAFRLAAGAFAFAILVGGCVSILFQREFREKRYAMTLLGKQRALIVCGDVKIEERNGLYMQVFSGAFLDESDRKQLLKRGRVDASRWGLRLFRAQNAMVMAGYFAMLSVAF